MYIYIYIYISILGTVSLLLNRRLQFTGSPPIVDGRPPPNSYRMPSLSSGGFKMHDVCIYIHFWRLRRAVSRIMKLTWIHN